MLYRDIIKDFADQEEADVIILPSSIHEVLLFPDHLMFDHAFLCRTVQEINREDVSEEDVLSDRIYISSRNRESMVKIPMAMAPAIWMVSRRFFVASAESFWRK